MRELCDWKAVLFLENGAVFLAPTRATWLARVCDRYKVLAGPPLTGVSLSTSALWHMEVGSSEWALDKGIGSA